MLKRNGLFLLVLIAAMALAACAGGSQQSGGSRANLEGPEWKLTELNGQPTIAGSEPTARFQNGEIGGTTGCNSYGGQYQVNGDSLTIVEMVQTEMACLADGVMEQEAAFTQAMMQAASYQATEDRLEIRSAGGDTTLVFSK